MPSNKRCEARWHTVVLIDQTSEMSQHFNYGFSVKKRLKCHNFVSLVALAAKSLRRNCFRNLCLVLCFTDWIFS